MPDTLPDLRQMLAPIGVERFFTDYWQRRMLAMDLVPEDFARILEEIGPLDIARLASATREGTQAWIANDYIAHSVIPVDASNAANYFDIGATLYFLNVPMDRLTNSIADFIGAPRQRVIASLFLTPATGGASPHFDKNENFTVQLTGGKRWFVGDVPVLEAAPEGYVLGKPVQPALAGLIDNVTEGLGQTVNLRPGSFFYVPRGVIHRTLAGDVSWSLNISYSRAMWLDLLRVGLGRRLAQSARWRGTVTGVGGDPSARAVTALPGLLAELRQMLADPDEVDRICQEFLEHPNG